MPDGCAAGFLGAQCTRPFEHRPIQPSTAKHSETMELDMPSQNGTTKNALGANATEVTPLEAISSGTGEAAGDAPERRVRLDVPIPRFPTIPTLTAVGSGGGLTAAIATGHVQPVVVWPAVVLAIAGMAYDVALRALARERRAR